MSDGLLERALAAGRKATTPESRAPSSSPRSDAFHGLAGEIVDAIDPHTEADPAGILLTTLCFFGNAVGPRPHAEADRAEHPARLHIVLVGETARSRKGTTLQNVRRLFDAADPSWTRERVSDGGLTSGEGLIAAVRDGDGDAPPVDKRFLVLESEFARVLAVAGREGNIISPVLRQAWDSGNLTVLTRKDPLKASGAHVSVVGNVTKEELLRRLTSTEMANGFANRFLFAAVKRSKVLPNGGAFQPGPLATKLRLALTDARRIGLLRRSPGAEERWDEIYRGFPDHPGLLGAVTGRPEAQTLRLSVTYALLDGSRTIELPHLEAAYAVWEYAEACAAQIFGDSLGDPVADELFIALRAVGDTGLTLTQQRDLFARHVSRDRLASARQLLESRGLVETTSRETGGRPELTSRVRAPKARKAPKAPPYGANGAYGAPENGGNR